MVTRRRSSLAFALATALILCSGEAFSEDVFNGNRMYNLCTTGKSNPAVKSHATTYVSGVLNTLQLVQSSKSFPKLVCLPDGVTYEQAVDIFCKYLEQNPEQRSKNSAILIVASLARAFPCPN
ncbi:hypothetical protein LMG27198_28220 [Methylocystis echinoides]|uniref:Rap1a immunity protein domain-containing protein n=2 Tax=Methylocystis echinoides TaxID=29468 RepID=A0A9W6LSL9_9HYPH|nr:hypothetical protein LMG27198_28220 [Methylocystis echinoides]